MPLVTAAEFSRLARVSKVAISKAVNASPPRLILADGKLDTDNPVNATYLATDHGGGGRGPAPKKAPAKKPDTELTTAVFKAQAKRQSKKAAVPDGEDDLSPDERAEREKLKLTIATLMTETADLDKQKKVQSIALQRAQELRHLFKLAQDKKTVVPRESVRHMVSVFNASLGANIMRSPRRVIPILWSLFESGASVKEGELALESELSKAVAHIVQETSLARI